MKLLKMNGYWISRRPRPTGVLVACECEKRKLRITDGWILCAHLVTFRPHRMRSTLLSVRTGIGFYQIFFTMSATRNES